MKIKIVALFLAVALLVTITFASNLVSWRQNLTVQGIMVYREDGTVITEGSDQSSMWKWDDNAKSFNTIVQVKNFETRIIDISIIAPDLNPEWAFIYSGNVYGFTPNEKRSFALSVIPSVSATDSTGDFTITVSVV